MPHRPRFAPPPDKAHLPTKLASGTDDIRRLLAAGWTIVEDKGEAIIEAHHNGASTDVPEHIGKRIEQVLGDRPKAKRPRIHRPAP